MAIKRTPQKPRSSTTDKVFVAFVTGLAADPQIGEGAARRVEAALAPGETINAANLQNALFPPEEEP